MPQCRRCPHEHDYDGYWARGGRAKGTIGAEAEYTRSHDSVDSVGHITSTRLDIWFTPNNLNFLQSYSVDNSFIFKLKKSDHSAVTLTLDNQRGKWDMTEKPSKDTKIKI